MGTGRGNCIKLIPPDIIKLYAIDKSFEMVALTSKKYKNVEISVGDACHTLFPNKSMDLILCVGVSEYIAEIEVLIKEISRVLNDRGFAIITSSPPNIFNHFRKLAGHKLYLRSDALMTQNISGGNFKIVRINHTLLQDQYLLTKSS